MVSGKSEARPDVLKREVGEVVQNPVFGHTRGKVFEDIIHGDAQSSYARFPTALA